jgi:hypothetical protein
LSRVYSREQWADGDILTVEELNSEIADVAAEMNGHITSDNLAAGILTAAKFELDAFHELLWTTDAGPDNYTRENSDTQRWFSILSGTLTTEDGRVYVEAGATYDCPSKLGDHVELGIRIDGDIVARSGSSAHLRSDTLSAFAMPTVGAGTHTIEVVMRITPGDTLDPYTTSLTVTVNGRDLWAHFKAR